jgi:hypothetical protein
MRKQVSPRAGRKFSKRADTPVERNNTMSKPKSLRELRRVLLKALRVRHASDWEYRLYCQAWMEYANARVEAGRPILVAEYNRLHNVAR